MVAQVVLEPDGRIRIPPECLDGWQPGETLDVERSGSAVILRPREPEKPRKTWDDVFKFALKPGTGDTEPRPLEDLSREDIGL